MCLCPEKELEGSLTPCNLTSKDEQKFKLSVQRQQPKGGLGSFCLKVKQKGDFMS